MESSTRFSSTLGQALDRRADRGAARAGRRAASRSTCVVMAFTGRRAADDSKNDKKGRSEQSKNAEADRETRRATPSSPATPSRRSRWRPAFREPKIERLNPDIDAETLNAGQVLAFADAGGSRSPLAVARVAGALRAGRSGGAAEAARRRFPRRAGSSSMPTPATCSPRRIPRPRIRSRARPSS